MLYLPGNNSGIWKLRERGYPVGMIMSPEGLRNPVRASVRMPYAIDNGLFRPFGEPPAPDAERLRVYGLCARIVADGWHTPLFAVVPDVPYDGEKSRKVSAFHRGIMRTLFPSIPLAVAVQDGMTVDDIDGYDWCFLAGSSDWKEENAALFAAECKRREMYCHMARVNTVRRLRLARDCGYDSADGTGIWYGDKGQKSGVLTEIVQHLLAY